MAPHEMFRLNRAVPARGPARRNVGGVLPALLATLVSLSFPTLGSIAAEDGAGKDRRPTASDETVAGKNQLVSGDAEDTRLPGSPILTAPPRLATSKAVLIDGIHANDLTTVGIGPEVYEYHATCGCNRAFEYLRARGIRCDRVTEGRLSAARLAGYQMLFLNLVSAERPSFLVPEIAAIRSFILEGGSLLAVMDHTNAYFHAYRLEPLLAELDLEAPKYTVCEEPPRTVGSRCDWITVTRFKPHPVTAGLKCLYLQAGGGVDRRFAVALTSEKSWADAWSVGLFGEGGNLGFCGNLRRDPGEATGPLGVVLARQFGKGRIVIVGDQNMWGGTGINYADNYRLWLNSFAWLLDEDRLGDPAPYERWRSPRLVCYDTPDDPIFGMLDIQGCYSAWSLLNRYWWVFASDRLAEPCDLMVFAYDNIPFPAGAAASVAAHIRRGKNVLILNADSAVFENNLGVVGEVLKQLAPLRPIRDTRKGKIVLAIPQAGAIHLLGPDTVLDNAKLIWPTMVPSEADKARSRAVVEAVRDALPTK